MLTPLHLRLLNFVGLPITRSQKKPGSPKKNSENSSSSSKRRWSTQGLISDSLETLRNNPTPIGWGGSEAEIQESANETLTRARRLLQNLEVASGRIKNGTYGRCFGCKESHLIDPARLALAPHTTHCVPAKKKRDEISGMGPYVLLSEQVAVSA